MRSKRTISLVAAYLFVSLSCISGQDQCPEGYEFSFQNSCYKLVSKENWNEASSICALEEAHLINIKSEEEQQYIVSWLQNNKPEDTWIGLSKRDANDYVWTDGSPLEYSSWEPGKPSRNLKECVRLKRGADYQWEDRDCRHDHTFICEIEAIPKQTTTVSTTVVITTPVLTSHLEEPVSSDVTNTPETTETPKPQRNGLSSGAIAGAVIGSIILLVLLVLILFVIARCLRHKTRTKSGKTTILAFDGPYDLTIEGKSNDKPQNTEQPIYTDADGDNKQHPINADPTSTKPATNVYQSIGESSTDDNTVPVYVDIDLNNDAPNSKPVSATGDQGSGQETSLYYARSDSHQETIAAPNIAEQESCQEGSLYYAKSDSHPTTNGDLPRESNAANTGTGWEDNAAYSSFEDGELAHDQEQEGWEDNSIYAGSDPE